MNEVINQIETNVSEETLYTAIKSKNKRLKNYIDVALINTYRIYRDTHQWDKQECKNKAIIVMLETLHAFRIVKNKKSCFTLQLRKEYSCHAKELLIFFGKTFKKELLKGIILYIGTMHNKDWTQEKYILEAKNTLVDYYDILKNIVYDWGKNKA